jgi:hypothetical protein
VLVAHCRSGDWWRHVNPWRNFRLALGQAIANNK